MSQEKYTDAIAKTVLVFDGFVVQSENVSGEVLILSDSSVRNVLLFLAFLADMAEVVEIIDKKK